MENNTKENPEDYSHKNSQLVNLDYSYLQNKLKFMLKFSSESDSVKDLAK